MAKKQQGLFGAGDASIIQAATKAAFADAPVSLAPVFKGISAGYQNMLNSLAQSITNLANTAMTAFKHSQQEAKAMDKLQASVSSVPDKDTVEYFQNDVDEINELRKNKKLIGGELVRKSFKERREDRAKAEVMQEDLLTSIKKAKNDTFYNVANIGDDAVNFEASGLNAVTLDQVIRHQGNILPPDHPMAEQELQMVPIKINGRTHFAMQGKDGFIKNIEAKEDGTFQFTTTNSESDKDILKVDPKVGMANMLVTEGKNTVKTNAMVGTSYNDGVKGIGWTAEYNQKAFGELEANLNTENEVLDHMHRANSVGHFTKEIINDPEFLYNFISTNKGVLSQIDTNADGEEGFQLTDLTIDNETSKANILAGYKAITQKDAPGYNANTSKEIYMNWHMKGLKKNHDNGLAASGLKQDADGKVTKIKQGGDTKLSVGQKQSKAFVDKVFSNQPTVSLGGTNATWTYDEVNIGGVTTPVYYTKLTDGNYSIKSPWSLQSDYGKDQALDFDSSKHFILNEQQVNNINDELVKRDQQQTSKKGPYSGANRAEVFQQNVFSSHDKFTEGTIKVNKRHEDKAIAEFKNYYADIPGIEFSVTKFKDNIKAKGRDMITATIGDKEFEIDLDASNYTTIMANFEKWIQDNKPPIK
jgi:hypothetical protein